MIKVACTLAFIWLCKWRLIEDRICKFKGQHEVSRYNSCYAWHHLCSMNLSRTNGSKDCTAWNQIFSSTMWDKTVLFRASKGRQPVHEGTWGWRSLLSHIGYKWRALPFPVPAASHAWAACRYQKFLRTHCIASTKPATLMHMSGTEEATPLAAGCIVQALIKVHSQGMLKHKLEYVSLAIQ